jgi:hypothetical protein
MVLEIRKRGGKDMVSCVHIRAVLRDWTGEMARRRVNEYSAGVTFFERTVLVEAGRKADGGGLGNR